MKIGTYDDEGKEEFVFYHNDILGSNAKLTDKTGNPDPPAERRVVIIGQL